MGLYGDAALIRYQSHIQILVAGKLDGGHSYEKRDGRWQLREPAPKSMAVSTPASTAGFAQLV